MDSRGGLVGVTFLGVGFPDALPAGQRTLRNQCSTPLSYVLTTTRIPTHSALCASLLRRDPSLRKHRISAAFPLNGCFCVLLPAGRAEIEQPGMSAFSSLVYQRQPSLPVNNLGGRWLVSSGHSGVKLIQWKENPGVNFEQCPPLNHGDGFPGSYRFSIERRMQSSNCRCEKGQSISKAKNTSPS